MSCKHCEEEIDIFNEPYVTRTCKSDPIYCELFHPACAECERNPNAYCYKCAQERLTELKA